MTLFSIEHVFESSVASECGQQPKTRAAATTTVELSDLKSESGAREQHGDHYEQQPRLIQLNPPEDP
jgi:hypothetical protein